VPFSSDFGMPRFNPQSNTIEKYNSPNYLPESYQIPQIYNTFQDEGKLKK